MVKKRSGARGRRPALGVSLLEMLLVIVILGTLSGVVAPILTNVYNFWLQSRARTVIQADVRVALDTINRQIRQAQSTTVVVNQVSGQPPFSRIAFTRADGAAVTFYQQGNILYGTIGNATNQLSTHLAYVVFAYPKTNDPTIISVAITTQAPTYLGGKKTLQLAIEKIRIMN